MRHCVVLDSCFIIATADPADSYHTDAINIFNELLKEEVEVTIVIPPIALYEVIATLIRNGFTHNEVEEKIMYLLRVPKIITLSITETSAFRHSRKLLAEGSSSDNLRTADFMITCIGLDFEAQILTFDRRIWRKIKPIYPQIYYCSSVGDHADETSDFLNELELLAPRT
jgi:predicted nucleic acid-binding protein